MAVWNIISIFVLTSAINGKAMKRIPSLFFSFIVSLLLPIHAQTNYDYDHIQMERLDRGVVALRSSQDSVMVSWRYLQSDPMDTEFDIYRNGKHVGHRGAGESTTFVDYYPSGKQARYEVRVANRKKGRRVEDRGQWVLPSNAPVGYIDIPLDRPTGYKDAEGRSVNYNANDATVADLDGDGQLEIVLKWDPSNSRDNSQSGLTNNTIIDAYKIVNSKSSKKSSNRKSSNSKLLWRIDLGRNIRSGAHYTQFMVYDLDGDGRAELVCKTADGTIDGRGKVIGDPEADHRVGMEQRGDQDYHAMHYRGEQFRKDGRGRRGGFINRGPEFLTVFDGQTGAALHTARYVPERGNLQDWGDNYANRSERYLACVAYLDGIHPSVVMCRGYYTRTVLAAWDFEGKELKLRWVFDSNNEERKYAGQGNHNLRVADVDGDGRDEITYGSMCIDDDGTGLYSTGFGHGDAMHVTSFFPLDDRLQVWDCHENKRDGSDFRDAATGQVIFQIPSSKDVGRCMAADIDPRNPGLEMWSSASDGIRNIKGEIIDSTARIPINFGIWWDGDLLREMLDHESVSKYIPQARTVSPQPTAGYEGDSQEGDANRGHYDFSGSTACPPIMRFEGTAFNNGTKSNPCLAADILGDWREEVVVRTTDNEHLRIYVSPLPTPYRFHTFLHDPVYRHSVTTQNVAYNQPTNVGFYFGAELEGSGRTFRGWQF